LSAPIGFTGLDTGGREKRHQPRSFFCEIGGVGRNSMLSLLVCFPIEGGGRLAVRERSLLRWSPRPSGPLTSSENVSALQSGVTWILFREESEF
jgi:hypothetical protein